MDRHEVGWTITITVEDRSRPPLVDDWYDELVDAFDPWGGCISGNIPHAGYGATFSYRTELTDPVQVLAEGLALFRRIAAEIGLPDLPVTECELMTFAFHDRWLAS
jgi:hypothetical protein